MFLKEWKQILTGAWSVWLMVTNVILTAAAIWEATPAGLFGLSEVTYAKVGLAIAILTIIARITKQPKLAEKVNKFLSDVSGAMKKTTITITAAAVFAAGGLMTAQWEGLRTTPYKDVVGVSTVCVGLTNVEMRNYTKEECLKLFQEEYEKVYHQIVACFPELKRAPVEVVASAVDLGFNVGSGAVCRSNSTGGALKSGDWALFCNYLPLWVKAGGVTWKGLENRRGDFKDFCLSGLS